MTNLNHENEQIKRKFFEHLKGGEGFAENSVSRFAEGIYQWQIFSENDYFANFTKEKASAFIEWLKTRETKTKAGKLALVTQYNYLRRVKRFFKWISDQPEYKNKIRKTDIDFLRLSKKDVRIATSGTTKGMPTIEEVRKVVESIEVKNEIDMRDRAIICFALITGMRISAIVTLKMKNFEKESKLIDQNPGDGVLTKNSKRIRSTFFPIGWKCPEQYFIEWYDHLKSRGAKAEDPIFPSTLKGFSSKNSYSKNLVSSDFWCDAGGARKVFEKRCTDAGVPYYHPHSFRHLIVSMMSKIRLTEEEKRAISLNLGHENVGTTFGSYGYGSMNDKDAIDIVQKIKLSDDKNGSKLPEEEKRLLKEAIDRL